MATFKASKPPEPISVNRWLGINEATGLTNLAVGEMLRQNNFRITKDYKLEKREGHTTLINYSNSKNVQGIWEGTLGSKHVLISCNDGKVYEYNFVALTNTQIGTITDARTTMIYFESKLLFFNGTDYKEYNGTTFQDVVAYVPTTYVALAPDLTGLGVANENEQVNLLTGVKKSEYQGNGVATAYTLTETGIDAALVTCTVNGVTKTETTDFTVNRTTGVVTFTVAPANGSLVILSWTKVTSGHSDLVKKNRFAMTFGPGNDTSIFIWGNTTQKNRRSWCASLNAGYFPVNYFTNIGTNEFAITDIKAQNANYQVIFKEDRTHYSTAEYITATGTYDYPVYDLNESVGNVTYGGVQIINNNALSIKKSAWWYWNTTSVQDERNADVISQRLENSLSNIDLTTAYTFDFQSKKEYWCNVGSIVYVWNYGNNTMYTFSNISATCFLDLNGIVYYGSQGKIEVMGAISDNGVKITAQADTGFYSFSGINLVKSSNRLYVGLLPQTRTSLTSYFKTNKITDWKKINKIAKYSLQDFDNIDFDDFSFNTNRNPQTFILNYQSNGYVFIQFRLENDEVDESCTVLDFLVSSEVQGEV